MDKRQIMKAISEEWKEYRDALHEGRERGRQSCEDMYQKELGGLSEEEYFCVHNALPGRAMYFEVPATIEGFLDHLTEAYGE